MDKITYTRMGKVVLRQDLVVFLQDFKKYQGYSVHIEFTFSGKVSIGLARPGVKSLYSSTIDNEITTINLLQI